MLLAWLPVFLAYFPGLFAYDAHSQLDEYIHRSFTASHPPLHTLWLSFFYSLGDEIGSYTVAFSLHIITQMLIMAIIFTHVLCFLGRSGCRRESIIGLFLFFAFFPVHSVLSISCTKDVVFTGLFTLLALQIYHALTKPECTRRVSFWIKTVFLAVLTCLMRNNACYALLLFVPVAVLLANQPVRKRLAALLLCCFTLSFAAYQTVQFALGEDTVEKREMLSVPCQQLARVAVNEAAESNPYTDQIKTYIPNPEHYLTYRADPIKGQLKLETKQDTASFISLWLRVGKSYPLIYLDAFLQNTQGLWWMDDITHAESYGKGLETRQGYLLTDTKPGYQIEHESLFPPLEACYEQGFSANSYQNIPVLSFLFAPALYFWLTVLIAARAAFQNQKAVLLLCCLLLCYVCTLLLGPCVLIRYAYPLVVLVPVLLILTFQPKSVKYS